MPEYSYHCIMLTHKQSVMEVKEQYTPPRCEELDAHLEGVIAASPGPYNNPFKEGGDW